MTDARHAPPHAARAPRGDAAAKRSSGASAAGGAPSRGEAGRAKRAPELTRARILKTAVAEFAAHGFSGARTARIARRARVSVRMLYHYFGGKDALYVAVLEEVLARLRHEELQLDFEHVEPMSGLEQLFDFIDRHLGRHPELRSLLAYENLNRARHLERSARIPAMASPVIGLIDRLLQRGRAAGVFRDGVDALQLYVAMVGLAYYGKAHAFTLARIFAAEVGGAAWQADHSAQAHRMIAAFVAAPSAARARRVDATGRR